MYFPSGDHSGLTLGNVSLVSRVCLLVPRSMIQRSACPACRSFLETRRRAASGEKDGPEYSPGSPIFCTGSPCRLKMVICCSCGPRGGGSARNRSPSALTYARRSGTFASWRNSTLGFVDENVGDVLTSATITA